MSFAEAIRECESTPMVSFLLVYKLPGKPGFDAAKVHGANCDEALSTFAMQMPDAEVAEIYAG